MKYKEILLITLATFFVSNLVTAQYSSFDWNKVRYGGRLNVDFSNSNTSVIIAPSVVYQLDEQFSLGGSTSFGYTNFKDINTKLYNYGASILSYYNPVKEVQLSAELEQTFVNSNTKVVGETLENNFNFLALNLGAGYRLGNLVLGVRYDILYNEDKSLYASPFSPFIQVYF